MTEDQAEEVYMAWQAGFETDRGKIAEALLILKARESVEEEE